MITAESRQVAAEAVVAIREDLVVIWGRGRFVRERREPVAVSRMVITWHPIVMRERDGSIGASSMR